MFAGRRTRSGVARKFCCMWAEPRDTRAGGGVQTEMAERPRQAGMTKPERQTFVRRPKPDRTQTGPALDGVGEETR